MAMWYACAVFAAVGVIILLRMRQWLMAAYSAIAVALPLVFGTAAAMNRYVLVAFPIFIAYAVIVTKLPVWMRVAVLLISLAGLALITYLMLDPRHLFIG